jgi:hypothetical protein
MSAALQKNALGDAGPCPPTVRTGTFSAYDGLIGAGPSQRRRWEAVPRTSVFWSWVVRVFFTDFYLVFLIDNTPDISIDGVRWYGLKIVG